ncbi:MAG: hypothetical protein V7742_07300 [Halioglobus sp.]
MTKLESRGSNALVAFNAEINTGRHQADSVSAFLFEPVAVPPRST